MMQNNNPFSNPELLHPDLAADIATVEAWQAEHDPSAQVAATGIASVVHAAVKEHATANPLEAMSPDASTSFAETLTRSEQLFARLNLTLPSPDQLVASGVDFAALGTAHERMSTEGLEPRFVLAPSLNTGDWQQLYAELEADQSVNQDGRIKSGGLYIDDTVSSAWDTLSDVPDSVPVTLNSAAEGSCNWTLRLIPGTNRPTETNIAHNDPNYPDKPTVHEYLTLQASLLQAGEDPIDDSTWTWLNGMFENDSQAPVGRWNPDDGRVGLSYDDVGDRDDSLGVRLPVWGP